MPSESADQFLITDDEKKSDYVIARLALWAGDVDTAIAHLKKCSKPLRRREKWNPYTHPISASAARTLNQLRLRLREYATIRHAIGIGSNQTKENVLRSVSGHLGGVIWIESAREFELCAFLLELSWEAEFYRNVAMQSEHSGSSKSIKDLGYGHDRALIDPMSKDESTGLGWVQTGDMFVQVEVSDFCTISARGTWTATSLPSALKIITAPFQTLLDKIDPAIVP